MKQSKTTIKELTKRYRAVLLKCALINMAAFAIGVPSAFATDFEIGENDTATFTRVPGEGISRYNLSINGEQQNLSASDSLTITGGSLTINSNPVKVWLDWQGNGGITISGGTVAAENGETFSGYRSGIAISGTADIRTALSSEENMTISGGTINLSGIQNPEPELYFTEAMGVWSADADKEAGSLTVSGGNITFGKNRQMIVGREWNSDDGSDPDSYVGNINISGGTITLNDNAQIIRTDVDYTNEDGVFLKDYAPEELSKTTGVINISGGEVNLNGTAKIINHSNDGTIAISGTAVVNVNGNNAFEDATGTATATLSGGTINLNGGLTADIDATGGTIAFNNDNAVLNGILTGTIDTLNISGGTIENQEFVVSGDATISGGTFSKDAYIVSSNTIAVSGGALFTPGTGFETELEANDITVSGGTFNGAMDWEADNNMTVSGGTFNSSRIEFEAGNTLEIDSDGVSLTRTTGTTPFIFKAGTQINVTGTTGLATTETVVASSLISGKIIANNQSFIGNVGNAVNKWTFGNNTVYSVTPDAFGTDTAFNEANLTLNGNAIAGSGNYIWEIAGSGASDITAVSLTTVQNKLTADEINNSVTLTMAEIRRINSSQTKNSDDMLDVYEDVWDDIPWPASSYGLQDFVIGKWESGTALTEDELDDVEEVLRAAYSSYNTALDGYSANVTVTDSTIAMNGTSALANYSIADDEKGNITIDNSTVTVNGTNTISASKGEISFESNSVLTVGSGATLNIVSESNKVSFDNSSSLNLAGTLNGNIEGGTVAFNSASARLNGALSGTVNLKFNDNYTFGNINASNATLGSITIADGNTLDIGESRLTATNISGGILKATLTDAAKTSAIVTASATNVTLALDMSKASRDEVFEYKITDGTGFTFGDYNPDRYAVSSTLFDPEDAKTIGMLDGWTGGNLYILRLATAGEAAVEDLKNSGVQVSATEEKAIAALNDEVIEKLAPTQKAAAQKINALLDTAAGNASQMKQILREVAPEAAPSASQTASSNASAVISVVGTRMGGGSPAPAAGSGRSGGDYTAGAASVWAQGMYNRADLHKADGFDSDSTGFAAGFEYNINDSVKAGFGYAYTDTDIDTARSKTDVDTHTGFVYGEYKPNNFYVNGVLSYGHSKYDETTRLAGLKSDYRADTFAAQAMAGYTLGILTPEAGLRYTSVRQKAYTNALGARMSGKTLDTWTGVAGLKASKSFRAGKTTITPDAKLALTYDFKRDGQARTVTLANGSSYVAEGENMKRFGVELGAGVSVKVGNNTDISLSYEGKFKDHYTDHTGLINFKYNF